MSAMKDFHELGAIAMLECAQAFAGMDKEEREKAIEAMARAADTRDKIQAMWILTYALKRAWLKTQ